METSGKRIAIIGAGASGLTAIKCIREDGMTPVCFEKTDDIGGLWNYSPDTKEDGQASVMKSTVINTSKEKMCYSDFPIPDHFANFMHNSKVLEYFRLYADEFKLLQHIQFKTAILKVEKTEDFEETGRWRLKIKDLPSGTEREEIFDAVMVCTGHHGSKYQPCFPGSEVFKGKQIHTHDYKTSTGYEDKRIVVIGIGNSGGDVTVELARCAKQVFLSTRRGSWVINRVFDKGMPMDLALNRITVGLLQTLPINVMNSVAENLINKRFDHAAYGLKPNHRFSAQHPMVNDDLPNRIICGSVIIKPNVKRLTETGVEFDDGTYEDNIDVVIYGTGYIFGFPFIDESIISVKKNRVRLFKYVFPPELKHGTLAVIGCFQPIGALMPLSEMQSRWAAGVFKGTIKLPSEEEMFMDIVKKEDDMRERYVESQRHTIQVDWQPFMDDMADYIGCKPNFKELLLSDPRLCYHVYFGPTTPYQYRLRGPHPWAGARHYTMTVWDRVFLPLKTRKVDIKAGSQRGWFWYILAAVLFYVLFFWILG